VIRLGSPVRRGRDTLPGVTRTCLAAGVLLWVGLISSGCITRSVYEDVYQRDHTVVRLRSHKQGTTTLEKGLQQPFTIAPVRVAHILSRVDIRRDSGDAPTRGPAIPLSALYSIADGVSEAFAMADGNQEIVVTSVRKDRRLGVFNRDYLTSLILYRRDDLIFVHLVRSDWEIPVRREDRVPEPQIGDHPTAFRILPSQAMTLVDEQSVAVAWRDKIFLKPTRTRVSPTGQIVQRTILMESAPEESEASPPPQQPDALPAEMTPERLRALADLEDSRRRGELTETEYTIRKRSILFPATPDAEPNASPDASPPESVPTTN
jgi:hypothetical protein